MNRFASTLAAASCALALASCGPGATLSNLLPAPLASALSASIPAKDVIVGSKTFDGLEVAAAGYLDLPVCRDSNRPFCHERSATPTIKGAVRSGRIARNMLKAQVRQACAQEFAAGVECTKGIPVASYNTLIAASKTIDDATAAWRAATNRK